VEYRGFESLQGRYKAKDSNCFFKQASTSGNNMAYCYSIIGQYPISKICAFGIMLNEKLGH